MGRLSSDCSPLAVIVTVTSLKDNGAVLPVKNTFIHFPYESSDHKTGCVQRFRTEPARSRLSSLCSEEDIGCEDTASSADTTLSCDDFNQAPSPSPCCEISTPVASPCWTSRGTDPSALWNQPPSWAPTLPYQEPAKAVTIPAVSQRGSSPSSVLDDGSLLFRIMHRRAEGVSWGLDVTYDEKRQALVVNSVQPGGAIESWNRQVMDGAKADRAISVGDLIVSVNGMHGCQAIFNEFRCCMLLRMDVLRQRCDRARSEAFASAVAGA